MRNFLSTVLDLSVLLFAASSMMSVGLGYSVRELLAPLRHGRRVLLELLGNFVLVPLLAWGLVLLLTLDRSLEVGLILMASAGGAPLVIKLTRMAGEDVALAASVVMLLVLGTIIYMPMVVPLMLPEVRVSAWAIARPLLLTLLLPLAVGLTLRGLASGTARRLQPILARISGLSLVILVAGIFLLNFRAILGMFGTGAILAAFVLTGGAYAIGYLTGVLGGKKPGRRSVIALVTAERNAAAAIVVATQGFHDPNALVMVVICFLAGVIILVPIAGSLGRRKRKAEDGDRPDHELSGGKP